MFFLKTGNLVIKHVRLNGGVLYMMICSLMKLVGYIQPFKDK